MARRFDRWSRRSDEGITNDFNKFVAHLEREWDKLEARMSAPAAATPVVQPSNTFIPSGGGGPSPAPVPVLSPVIAVPAGAIPGTIYTLPSTPAANTLVLVKNGVTQDPGAGNDYTLSGVTITMLSATTPGDSLLAYYWTT